ncbi:MAG: hypothetical protein KTR31_41935 [Myxococcales bacterium]|nr:hypothetical protein [Myxococcales bacterium]
MRWTVGVLCACAGVSEEAPLVALDAAKGDVVSTAELRVDCVDDPCSLVEISVWPPVEVAAWSVDGVAVEEAATLLVRPSAERVLHIQAKTPSGDLPEGWLQSIDVGLEVDPSYDTNTVFYAGSCNNLIISTVGGCLQDVDVLWFHSGSHSVQFDVRTPTLVQIGYALRAQWSVPNSLQDMKVSGSGPHEPAGTALPGPHFTHWTQLGLGQTRWITVMHQTGDSISASRPQRLHCTETGSLVVGDPGN